MGILQAGVVTLNNWTMVATGEKFLYLFCKNWKIMTDTTFPIENFHSSERWQLIGKNKKGNACCVIPGCQVKGFLFCEKRPPVPDCYEI